MRAGLVYWALRVDYIHGLATMQDQNQVPYRRIYLACNSVGLPPGALKSVFAETSPTVS